MENKTLHPALQGLAVLMLVLFLSINMVSAVELFDSGGPFDDIRRNYEPALILAVVGSSVVCIVVLYLLINSKLKQPRLDTEAVPIVRWSYRKYYWRNFKIKEFRQRGFRYTLKLLLIWTPIISSLFGIYMAEPLVGITISLWAVIISVPLIPVTIGRFIGELENQVFQESFEVAIYKNGLTINGMYYPFHHYQDSDTNTRLVSIKQQNIYATDCLAFTVCKQFYSPPTADGGDYGTVLKRTSRILIPIPKDTKDDLVLLKKQVNRKSKSK